jgi:hypothetical protein
VLVRTSYRQRRRRSAETGDKILNVHRNPRNVRGFSIIRYRGAGNPGFQKLAAHTRLELEPGSPPRTVTRSTPQQSVVYRTLTRRDAGITRCGIQSTASKRISYYRFVFKNCATTDDFVSASGD